jgi:hypothetical protein
VISGQARSAYDRLRALAAARDLVDFEATRRLIDLSKNSAFRSWQQVGDPGNPALGSNWTTAVFGIDKWTAEARYTKPWYFRDNWGFVHLRGHARAIPSYDGSAGTIIFTLPPDLWPEFDTYLPAHSGWALFAGDGPEGYVVYDNLIWISRDTGDVRIEFYADFGEDHKWVTFNNMMFRAANAGVAV